MRAAWSAVLLVAGLVPAAAGEAKLVPDLDAVELVPAAAHRIDNAALDLGGARIEALRGVLVPTTSVLGTVVEWVFAGEGRFRFAPESAVEQQQLQLFAGSTALYEGFQRAVFVGNPEALRAVYGEGTPVNDNDAAGLLGAAREEFKSWRGSVERSSCVGQRLAHALAHADAANDVDVALASARLGRIVAESRTVPFPRLAVRQFVPKTLTESERFEIEKVIERSVRSGHFDWLDFSKLGTWNTWSEVRDLAVSEWGRGPFEVRRYVLDLTLQKGGEDVAGRGTLELVPRRAGERVVALQLAADLTVDRVTDDKGRMLGFLRRQTGISVALADAPALGASVRVTVDYHGPLMSRLRRGVYMTWSTQYWYPVCEWEVAPYDVTVHWPKRLSLIASGHRVDGGEADGQQWERRVMDLPTDLFGFQIGDFEIREQTFGHVHCTFAVDKETRDRYRTRYKEFLNAAAQDLVQTYEETFGRYPLDELAIVTTWQSYSQGMLGFVTLSAAQFEDEDPRMIMAHELAHQWWGSMLRPAAARDTWLIEGLSSYTAAWYARSLPRPPQPLTLGWSQDLFARTERGQSIESIGPLVLGPRADSSLCPGCDGRLMYMKAPLVLETLAVTVGEKAFNAVLRELAGEGTPLTTETFIERLAKKSGRSLGGFAARFVYGTGIDYLFYRATIGPDPAGSRITLHVEAVKAPEIRVRVARLASGAFDVLRQAPEDDTPRSYAVPFRAYEKSETGERAVPDLRVFGLTPRQLKHVPPEYFAEAPLRRKGRYATDALQISGAVTDRTVPVKAVVDEVLLDPARLTFVRAIDEGAHPGVALNWRTVTAIVTNPVRAEQAIRTALAGPLPPLHQKPEANDAASVEASLRTWLARALLDQGKVVEARAELERVQKSGNGEGLAYATEFARLAAIDGDAKGAFKALWNILWDGDEHYPAGSWAVMAVVARAAGEKNVYERALAKAKKLGVDVSELEHADGRTESQAR